ncbi:flagellar hook-associated protein FlgK [Cohnella thailandensis]|uniref:Flagellar hook-associated protein 1 n=1 Tax=Cohnella thailandensis TaxID=557557 RepID=A0A841SJ98_9BACL|nr:flagellar hook-associated protein FlgK [Cohnella thailandensis]MBB6632593.1 flagellar hook-associated protein FlgK [Cohnella thailandensis]MBP1971887.1 flagellar hook-associated protein 1 FlgK [Cohnella thailandensis]
MRSTFMGLETAKRSLMTQQTALQTTGHNVANANTAGYTRQTVNMVASRPIEAIGLTKSTAAGQIGTGVEYDSVTRIREKFLDLQYRNENKTLGNWTIRQDTLEKLETVFNEPSDTSLRSAIDNFFNSWNDLAESPEDETARKLVRENALSLADAFNQTSKQLTDLSDDLTENIAVKTAQLNTITSTIAELNGQIRRIEALGDNANDLRDQRDLLADELSGIANITVAEAENGDYQISIGATQLVNGDAATAIDAATIQGLFNADLTGGEIYGMIYSRDVYVADYKKQLDTLASGLANGNITVTIPAGSVLPEGTVLNDVPYTGEARTLKEDLTVTVAGLNGLHKLGYSLGTPLTAGGDFFVASDGGQLTAANFSLSKSIQENASLIASSMRTVTSSGTELPVKGNNGLALIISQLGDVSIDFSSVTAGADLTKTSANSFFRGMVGQLGVQTEAASRQATNSKSVVDQVDGRRISVSGVSLDEEMSNMVVFQHAYNAAARMMTTVDEMLDRIINGTGVVGR